jgi:predicted ferric reductase
MVQAAWRIVFWGGVYLACAALPLILGFHGDLPEGRGFLVEFGAGLGLVGFSMLGLQFLTTARYRWIAPHFGADAIVYFHRRAGILVLGVVLAHPILLFVAEPAYWEYLDPRVNVLRALFLTAATLALILVVVLPLWGLRLGLSYEWWRVTHGLLAGAVIVVGCAHALQVGHYVNGWPARIAWVLATLLFLGLLVQVRIWKPFRIGRTPYRVREVLPQRGDVAVLVLEADGHRGLIFQPGQYAWLTLGPTPFSLQQHPFSFASSADSPQQPEFAIKASGDFTARIAEVEPGTRAYLEGPYGAFTLDPRAEAAVFVVGGIGVTPALSILRTAGDRQDGRPFVLFYGNVTQDEIAFHDELDRLAVELDLQVIHVLSEPEDDWQGESGFITPDILERYLVPVADKDIQYFICGPTPLMDSVERILLGRGVPRYRLLSERFDFI